MGSAAQGHTPVRRAARAGNDGNDGRTYRFTEWAEGFDYKDGSELIGGFYVVDVACTVDSSGNVTCKMCTKAHNSSNVPFTTSEYWKAMNYTTPIYTPFLLASGALIRLLQTNQLLVMKADGVTPNVALGGGSYPLWIGAATADDASFKVDDEGVMTATGADIEGTINSINGKIGGFTLGKYGMTNTSDASSDATDNYIILKNDTRGAFAGIGGNVLPGSTGTRAVAIFHNYNPTTLATVKGTINIGAIAGAQHAYYNTAILLDSGHIARFAERVQIVSSSTTIDEATTCVVCTNTEEITIKFPVMQAYDDGHVIEIKNLNGKNVIIQANTGYNTSGTSIQNYIHYDSGSTGTSYTLSSAGNASRFVYAREVSNGTYTGCWLQFKCPRSW